MIGAACEVMRVQCVDASGEGDSARASRTSRLSGSASSSAHIARAIAIRSTAAGLASPDAELSCRG